MECDITCEFEDFLQEIDDRYRDLCEFYDRTYGFRHNTEDDILYIQGMIKDIKQYKKYGLEEYLTLLADLSRSLYYFQKSSGMVYNIPLLQLITYVNTFISLDILSRVSLSISGSIVDIDCDLFSNLHKVCWREHPIS